MAGKLRRKFDHAITPSPRSRNFLENLICHPNGSDVGVYHVDAKCPSIIEWSMNFVFAPHLEKSILSPHEEPIRPQ
jgi:hypothetical protein